MNSTLGLLMVNFIAFLLFFYGALCLVIIVLLTASFVLHQPNNTCFKQVLRLQDRISDPKFKIKGAQRRVGKQFILLRIKILRRQFVQQKRYEFSLEKNLTCGKCKWQVKSGKVDGPISVM